MGILNRIWGYLAAAGALLSGLVLWGQSKKKQGRDETYIEMRAKDHENADQIRDRVDRNLDERVRKLDDAGWRD
ncbi:hypothetical protein [Leisingera sp. ANG-M7]|uniref:hypothetical protein n=1 Tax=Leisingera sp. ANG-M7 TaxID=1577902 RepID=UPI00057C401F|nr:hypothetical protein [Leisingera sp. ANG-M7]KIC39349.1 hypothetical protein RA26_01465 [Leisingera sp. ANG-M7]